MSIGNVVNALSKGNAVSDPGALASTQITATVAGGLVLCALNLIHAAGYPVPVDTITANEIGGAVLTLWNVALTVAQHKHLGT